MKTNLKPQNAHHLTCFTTWKNEDKKIQNVGYFQVFLPLAKNKDKEPYKNQETKKKLTKFFCVHLSQNPGFG